MNKLLIADDQENMRLLLRITFEGEGFEIYEAKDGMEAIELAKKIDPDLIIIDYMMPGLNGYKTMERLREIDPKFKKVPFIIITAKDLRCFKDYSKNFGAVEHITKPFDPEDLLEKVKNITMIRDGG